MSTNPPPDPADFDRFADAYDDLLRDPIRDGFAGEKSFFVERKLDVMLRLLRSQNLNSHSLKWLDVGCGRGELLRMGRQHFQSVAGCDPSLGMLKACGELEVRHQVAMDSLPFSDASFDFISVVCVYHHVELSHRRTLTHELMRTLRPGGIVCIVEHNPLNPVTRVIVSRTPVDADARLLKTGETRNLLSGMGASVIATRYFLLLPERLFRMASVLENALERLPFAGQYAVFARK